MVTLTEHQLDTYLDSVVNRAERLRQRNLFTDTERQLALEEIQDLQGALAMCRGLLRRIEPRSIGQQRRAAWPV